MENDVSYFSRRASEERAAALQSLDMKARRSHLEMAERYDDLIEALITNEDDLGLKALNDQ